MLTYFKGTVSPDIAFYFTVYKLKSVLSVRPLMAYKFVYFVVLLIYKHTFETCFYENAYQLCRSLLKPGKESFYRVSESRL
jgi:hypothetical protein